MAIHTFLLDHIYGTWIHGNPHIISPNTLKTHPWLSTHLTP